MTAQRHSGNLRRAPQELIRESLRFQLEQTGADPSGFLDSLETSVKLEAWTHFGLPDLASFIVADYPNGIGASIATVRTLLSLKHRYEATDPAVAARMATLRATVTDLLTPAVHDHGGSRQADNISLPAPQKTFGDSPDYIVGRLKRDHPALARRVLAGELSAHKAAVEAGFRRKSITVPLDPVKAARTLARHFSDDEWRAFTREVDAISREGSAA